MKLILFDYYDWVQGRYQYLPNEIAGALYVQSVLNSCDISLSVLIENVHPCEI